MKKSKNKFTVIACPNCGYEYLPAELYVGNCAIGQPLDIMRDEDGHIIDFTGSTVDLCETYECDKCGKIFNINGKINFTTTLNTTLDFDEDYSYKITDDKITCKEEF